MEIQRVLKVREAQLNFFSPKISLGNLGIADCGSRNPEPHKNREVR